MATTTRMLQLLSLLQARRDWPGPTLADRLDVSERTVRRDVDRLREMGYRIRAIKGPDGGYRLDAGAELPPLLFDDDQAVVLAVALQTVAVSGPGFEEAAARALTTVRQVMPARLRHRIDVLRSSLRAAVPTTAAPVDAEVLTALTDAVHERRTMRIDYRPVSASATDEPVRRRIEPHHLVQRAGRWYLVAWDLDRDAWRVYRADRIEPRTPLGAPFRLRQVPGGDAVAYVEARVRGATSGTAWPCRGSVVLAAPAADIAPFVVDGEVTPLDDDRCRVDLGSWSWEALAASAGRFGVAITEPQPAELAEAFRILASRYAAAG